MPSFAVRTPQCEYQAHVERGIIERAASFLPEKPSRIFVVTTEDVWRHQGARLEAGLRNVAFHKLVLPGGEDQKRLVHLETAASEMMERGGDRSSLVIAFGGGIVNDMAGFLASIFMRGIPVVQIPTTLLAQVDAAVGGKTGVNLLNGKNLIGTFHQPHAVLVDPAAINTLPEREYRAGLYEVIKHGVIASEPLFRLFENRKADVLGRDPEVVDRMIGESVRIKAEVVSADEREGGLRRILNFGHTFGHALEAETGYKQLLHGEAVAWGMRAASFLAESLHMIDREAAEIRRVVESYGPIPSLENIRAEALEKRLYADKKTLHGKIHFVLPVRIGEVEVRSGVSTELTLQAIRQALQ